MTSFRHSLDSLSLDEDISEDEKNIIMYVCGYVPVALKCRYEKRKVNRPLEKKTRHALKSYCHTGENHKFVVDKIMARS